MHRPSILEFERQERVFIVAEVAQAHDGSLGILHSFVDACAGTGVDAVKFQIHMAEAESSGHEPFRIAFSHEDKTRFEYWQRMSFSAEQWAEVKRHCDQVDVEFLATPFSNSAVGMLENLDVRRYKIGSGDIANLLLIERVARTGKEAILSTGLGTFEEIAWATNRLRKNGVAVLQCTTRYPTSADDVGLAAIAELKRLLACPAGLSDHSGKIYPGIAAAALGASIVEAHITFDRRMFGPDAKASLTVDEFTQLVEGIRFVEKARSGSAGKALDPEVRKLRETFGRTIAVNRDLPAGHVLAFEDLEGKKPAGQGISAGDLDKVLGRRLTQPKSKWDFLMDGDLQ